MSPSLTEVPSERVEAHCWRRDGRIEQLRDIVGRPAQNDAQDQHGTLAWWQVLQAADERHADRVALHCKLGADTICSPQSDRCRPHS
jgi:hypothetical protein